MEDYELYEIESKKIRKENVKILENFESYLKEKNLSKNTIEKHLHNVRFYINEYLHYEEPTNASKGIDRIGYFLGDWFIRKAMWSSVAAIKENITSLKHFYTFLNSIGEIDSDQLIELKEEIKENKNEWYEASQQYDDPDSGIEDDW
jgi:site-specific recombinase XerD